MFQSLPHVVFTLDEQQYAIRLSAVERVVQAAQVTPLPGAPDVVLGVIAVEGQMTPVVNLRQRFRLPERPIELSDHFMIARTARRRLVLVADTVRGVVQISPQSIVDSKEILPGLAYLAGVARLGGDLLLIHDLDTLLSLDEEKVLSDIEKEGA
jgi:purine-binding chemotaxis protein CheW